MKAPRLIIAALFTLVFLLLITFFNSDRTVITAELFSMTLLWVPYILEKLNVIKLPLILVIGVGIVLLLHAIGQVTDWYETTFWWDKLTHMAAGLLLSLMVAMAILIITQYTTVKIPAMWVALLVFLTIVVMGITWEMIEFSFDHFLGRHMQYSLQDTMNDLIVDSLAGIIGGLSIASIVRRSPSESVKTYVRELGMDRTMNALRRFAGR